MVSIIQDKNPELAESFPLVSIVLPVYNGARYLAEAIESVLAQTYPYWELILVDDASTDTTPEIIAGYVQADERISTVRHEENRRLPGALNTGFALARGEYLTWTSDDNCYRPEALAQLTRFLAANPGVDLVYSDLSVIDSRGRWLKRVIVREPEALAYSSCVGACFLYRRRVQECLGGYSQEFVGVEDYEFWLRASLYFRLKPLHEDLFLYRTHESSLSSTQTGRVRMAGERLRAHYLPQLFWASPGDRAEGYLRLVYMASLRRDWRSSARYLGSALVASPARVAWKMVEMLVRLGQSPQLRYVIKTDYAKTWEVLRSSGPK